MDDEIQLVSDGDGLAVIGDPLAVERFLVSEGVPSKKLARLGTALRTGAGVALAGSAVAAGSGRWMKLTKESARTSAKGLRTGVLKGNKDLLRAQKDAVLARMIGVGFVIEEAMTRPRPAGPGRRGHLVEGADRAGDDRGDSGVRAASLDAVAEKLERKSKIGDIPRRPRHRSGWPSRRAASNCRTRSPYSNSIG